MAFLLAGLLPEGGAAAWVPPLLLVAVLGAALALGLAGGLAGATAGFGLMLWRGGGWAPDGGWALSLAAVIEAFAWFAAAKLAVALVALPRRRNRRLADAAARAGETARRQDLLLAEWSHRVSNDLYLQVSMLRAQAGADPGAAGPLRAAAGRVQVLGRVHGRLSRGAAAGAPVDSHGFLEGLVADLRAAVQGGQPVALALTAESHPLALTAACDLGLVLNELVTNALKHAFPGGRVGSVRMAFRRQGEVFELVVADDGVGTAVPAGRGSGLGTQLMRGLATQLGGRVDVASGEVGGTVCTLRFPVTAPGAARDAAGAGTLAGPSGDVPAAPRDLRTAREG